MVTSDAYILLPHAQLISGEVVLPRSKSLSNRALIIQALGGTGIKVEHLSQAQDTVVLQKALQQPLATKIDVGHAGTAMRFLTAYLALQPDYQLLTGSSRMCLRPIGPLVTALQQIGAVIEYADRVGFPPLIIGPFDTEKSVAVVALPAHISSQFVSALCMVAPYLPAGLTIKLLGKPVSYSYIAMTLQLMEKANAKFHLHSYDEIVFVPQKYGSCSFIIEPDWSAAAYFFGLMALSAPGPTILLRELTENTLQGDGEIKNLMSYFGVAAHFTAAGLALSQQSISIEQKVLVLDLIDTPDLIQTICVVAAGRGMALQLAGWQTLRNKETDRVLALQIELAKVGVLLTVEGEYLHQTGKANWTGTVAFDTYEDHRMAMSFSLLALLGAVQINNPEVVSKSFPLFWTAFHNIVVT